MREWKMVGFFPSSFPISASMPFPTGNGNLFKNPVCMLPAEKIRISAGLFLLPE